jgi:hypothetical protein
LGLLNGLMIVMRTISQILAAGIAITAFALLLNTFSFNLKDRVARSFTIILICVLIIFTADAIGSSTAVLSEINIWMRIQWVGLIFIPPAYFHFSDALLETTGRPSMGKRIWAVRITYLASSVFILLIPLTDYLGFSRYLAPNSDNVIPGILSTLFVIYYISSLIASWTTYIRALRRTTTPTTRRRMTYLVIGAIAPALGFMPYLFSGSVFATQHNLFYWTVVMLTNLFTGAFIVIMAYSVAFFGVSWPDRVVKRRLFKWIMRGPVTAIFVLGVTTILRRAVVKYSLGIEEWIPISMVLMIILMEYAITMFSPIWERWFFYGKDRIEIELTTDLADRLMTRNDLSEYLETILSAISDRFRAKNAFIATYENNELKLIVKTGKVSVMDDENYRSKALAQVPVFDDDMDLIDLESYRLMPLFDGGETTHRLLGILGMELKNPLEMNPENQRALRALSSRIKTALRNREVQESVYQLVQNLNPQFEQFQKLRAQTRFADTDEIIEKDYDVPVEVANMVKDALTHFWGGPKLTESPLIHRQLVQDLLIDESQTPVNALRSVLRSAIEKVKPEGERKYTSEWVLYNILDLKFIQGKKVREVALRLALSEADLYRKQRVAIEAVARAILDMENESSNQ